MSLTFMIYYLKAFIWLVLSHWSPCYVFYSSDNGTSWWFIALLLQSCSLSLASVICPHWDITHRLTPLWITVWVLISLKQLVSNRIYHYELCCAKIGFKVFVGSMLYQRAIASQSHPVFYGCTGPLRHEVRHSTVCVVKIFHNLIQDYSVSSHV